ncbi:DsbE family thiol:disulfide interchange protein [Actibacterium sp. D379-3]
MLLPPLLFAGLAALFFLGMGRDNPDELPSTRIGQQAPALTVTALGEGAPFDDATLRTPGVKLVNFWASWCAPCRVEHPVLEQLAAEGVPIYGINYKDDPLKAMNFLKELGDPYAALAADGDGRTALEWGVYGVPETYVIDSSGTILHRTAGPITRDILEKTIRPAIAAAQ